MPSTETIKHSEAARYLGIHPITLSRAVERGDVSCIWVGSLRRYKKEDLDNYIQENTEAKATKVEAK